MSPLKTLWIATCVIFNFYNCVQVRAKEIPTIPAHAPEPAWGFSRSVSVVNNGAQVNNAVIEIQLHENFDYKKVKAGGADLRFSLSPGKFKGTGLSYWIEQWNENGQTRIWVKIPLLKAKSQNTITMHYGNSYATPVSDGNKTFLFFDDFEDGSYTGRWNNISVGEVTEHNGQLSLKESDGQDGIISANFTIEGKMIIRTTYQRGGGDEHWTRAGIGGWDHFLCFGDHTDFAGTGTNYVMIYDSGSLDNLKTPPLVKVANNLIDNQWHRASFWYDGHSLKGMQDNIATEWIVKGASSKLSLRTLDNDAWDNFAYITVSPFADTEEKVNIGEEVKQDVK